MAPPSFSFGPGLRRGVASCVTYRDVNTNRINGSKVSKGLSIVNLWGKIATAATWNAEASERIRTRMADEPSSLDDFAGSKHSKTRGDGVNLRQLSRCDLALRL